MVGLERGIVRLEPHRTEWRGRYEAEASRLHEIVGDRLLAIKHVGSTAIEGMPAKPIVDLLGLVESLADAENIVPVLEEHGYEQRPDEDVSGRLFLAKGPETNRTQYLSLAERGGRFHREKITFRDSLREHRAVARRYASLKRRLASRHPNDRSRYTEAKGAFVRGVLDRAMTD